MPRPTVVVMPGDGIGRIVVPEALEVLAASGFEADFVEAEIGWSCWARDGDPLPPRTIEMLDRHRLGFLGAVTSKPPGAAEAELPAALQGRGLAYRSPLLTLRQRFGLEICLRPCAGVPGNPANFVRRGPDGAIDEPPIDIAVFRQNTEGLYAGVEWTDPPAEVRRALASHPSFAPFREIAGRDLAVAARIVTRGACFRIADAALRYASERGIGTVTLAEKPNVLRETSGLFEDAAREAASRWPGIALRSVNIDALLLDLVRRPEEHRIIVASNLFGDLLSDAVAGLTGGAGFACSANLGADAAIFEPAHGSAPRHAERSPSIVNPIAAILTGALLAERAGARAAASRVRRAVGAVVAAGKVRTYDMLGLPSREDVLARGASPTRRMTEAILKELG